MENNEEIKENENTAEDFIKELNDLKANMIPKDEYDKVVADNNKFKKALLNGASMTEAEQPKTLEQAKKAYVEAINKGASKLEGFKASLELRDASIRETGVDPYMDPSKDQQDPNFGERTAALLQDIVDKADGDPNAFDAYFKANLK